MTQHILITGAGGFIGRYLINRLLAEDTHISTIGRHYYDLPKEIDQHIIDIRDTRAVTNCIRIIRPDRIFHLAAYKERNITTESFSPAIKTNLIGSLNLFTAAKKIGSVQSIVILGTAEEYGNTTQLFKEGAREIPVTPYSFSKVCTSHLAELFYRLYDTPIVILRPTLAYGPGQGTEMFLPALITSLLNDKPFEMTMGEQTRDFIYIDDLVNALIAASTNSGAIGEVINIGSGNPRKLIDVAREVEKIVGKPGLVLAGAKPYRKNEVMDYCADISKAKEILEWKPKTPFKDGRFKTIEYYRGVKRI